MLGIVGVFISKLVLGTCTGNPSSRYGHSMNVKSYWCPTGTSQSESYLIWRTQANRTQREGWRTYSLEDGEHDEKKGVVNDSSSASIDL